MKNTLLLLLSLLAVSIVACQEDTPAQKAENIQRDAVMVIHDEVMPKMGEMHQLKRKLKKLTEANAVSDTTDIETIEKAILRLEEADEGMMSWMNQFKQPAKLRGDHSHEEIIAYLEGELVKIQKVKADMLGSIENAKELLASYSQAE